MTNKPHIIIFNPDQFRADALGHLGSNAAITPNMDKICTTDGISFRNAFCQNPVCTPSRCSFMSGWYPHVMGHRTMHHMMTKDQPVLLKTLKEHGYFVWWGGKNDLVPAQNGYDDYCNLKYNHTENTRPNLHNSDDWRGDEDGDNFFSFYAGELDKNGDQVYNDSDWNIVAGATKFIRNAPKDKPLCLYLALDSPHPPYGVEQPWFSMAHRNKIKSRIPTPKDWTGKPSILKGIYDRQGMQGWSEQRFTELRAVYLGMCSRVDFLFGLVCDALKDAGIYDDSAIFILSDHGDFTGDYGLVEKTQNTFEDCLTNVPFIIKPPLQLGAKPHINDALVELIDFPSTVEELVGIRPEHDHFGVSLVPLMKGQLHQHRDAVFCEGGRRHGEPQCMDSLSLDRLGKPSLYTPRLSLQCQEGPTHTKAVMVRTTDFKYVYRLYESDELYELKTDPYEQNNRINDPMLKAVVAEMQIRMLEFFVETGDVVPRKMDSRG